jgi:hypothetical protein
MLDRQFTGFHHGGSIEPVSRDAITPRGYAGKSLVLGLFVLLAASVAGYAQEGDVSPGNAGGAIQMYTTCVLDRGAKGDGTTDDTAAFQAALDGAAAKGGSVFVPMGTYLIAGSLSVPQGVTLKGVWESPHHADIGKGSILYATGSKGKEDGPPLVLLHQSSAVVGITVFYPEQNIDDIQPYPWCIQGTGMHCSVIDVTLVNPYKGIDFGTNPNELHFISNVFGQPLKIGIFIDKTTDIGRIENVHFNPHSWAGPHSRVRPPAESLGRSCNSISMRTSLVSSSARRIGNTCATVFASSPRLAFISFAPTAARRTSFLRSAARTSARMPSAWMLHKGMRA